MYSASNAFHNAVKNGAHQIALLIFDDAVFSNEDINVTKGIEFNDYFCTEENLAIGQALSNEISFTLFNDHGYLNDYAFGDFLATIGVMTEDDTVFSEEQPGTTIRIRDSNGYAWYGSETSPYIHTIRTYSISSPGFVVKSLLSYNGYVYAFGANGECKRYAEYNGAMESVTLNDFMKHKVAGWGNTGYRFVPQTRQFEKYWTVHDHPSATLSRTHKKTYEFVPLGYFTAERPNVPNKIEINFNCYDWMQKFEKDMPSDADLDAAYRRFYPSGGGYSYPVTFTKLFRAMCAYADLRYWGSFVNASATISARPDAFNSATMREVLGWLAEAAGSVARVNRDGYVQMDWIRTTNQQIDENGYSEFDPYWYKTKTVTKLCNRASNGDYDKYSGTGNEAYLIQDNPLLKGVE